MVLDDRSPRRHYLSRLSASRNITQTPFLDIHQRFYRVSRGSVLGRFWRVLERYHHCGAVAVSHDRNRGRVRSLCTVGVLFRANTLSCFPCLSEWICFCGTPFRFCACATRCTSGYTRLNIQIDIHPENNTATSAILALKKGTATNLPYVAFENKKRTASENQDGSKTGGILLYFDESHKFQKGYYVPPIAWETFAIRLFLRGVPSDALKPVYETQKAGDPTAVKVWEIHYPTDIQTDPKYLRTGIPEIDAQLQLQ